MKKLILALTVLGVAWAAPAVNKAELEIKAQKLIAKFQRMQEKPDKRVPADALRKARGIILLDRTKAGFVFAFQGGGGIAMVKDKKDKWGPIAFLQSNEGSIGFQIGGQQSFLVILLMNDASTKTLIADSAFEVGGEARGTAGDTSAGTEGKFDSIERGVQVYDDRKGLFGGAALKAGALEPNHDENFVYYGAPVTMQEILFDKKVKASDTATRLARKIEELEKSAD
ncbi:MAG TPA: lipid-binding SYLF domain-containing protein [Verrucomicrobiae bacterium]